MKKPYLLLDAGGTFVFIDQEYLAGVAKAHGFPVSAMRIYDEHYRLIHWFDTYVARHRTWPPRLDRPYTQVLFEAVGLPEGSAAEAASVAEAAHKEKNLWTFTFPWVRRALVQIRDAGYRMSVISNADGRVQQQLEELGLEGHFEAVYDSQLVGTQKPDPRIFETALSDLCLRPEETLYVGDMFHIDVLGANRAGIPALHLDPLSLYGEWPGERVRDFRQLPDWLQGYSETAGGRDLHPLADFALEEEGGPR